MTTETTMTTERVNEAQSGAAVHSSAWLDDMTIRWRAAEKHWRAKASAREDTYSGSPCYEDGMAEAFGRCAEILLNERMKHEN